MADVTYQLNRSNKAVYRKRFRRRLALFITSLIILALLVGIILYILNKLEGEKSQSAVGPRITSHIAGPKLFKNNYFEFYSNDDWSYDKTDSTSGRVMYVLRNEGVVAGSFVVYVNNTPIPDDLGTSMVLPLSVSGNSFTHVGAVSEPCGQAYAPGAPKYIHELSLSSTSLLCVPDTSEYTIILGQIGGDYNLKMRRSNGAAANYIVIYKSSSFTPTSVPFLTVVNSFKSL